MSHDPDVLADAYHDRLRDRTPVAWATIALIAANVAVYLAMVARGDNGLTADARRLVAWGGNFGPLTRSGEWWRLLTAAFLHGGALHIALNMLALRSGGPLLERSIGSARFLAVYLLTAAGAGLGTLAITGYAVSVGASGAVFGVYGALLGLALQHAPRGERLRSLRPAWARRAGAGGQAGTPAQTMRSPAADASGAGAMPPHLAERLAAEIVVVFVLNLLIGLTIPGIDNAAHIAGFGLGLLLGWTGAGAVAAHLRAGRIEDAPAPGTLPDRSRWFVPAAGAVSLVLAASAVFPWLPLRARLATFEAGCRAGLGSACLAAGREAERASGARDVATPLAYFQRGCQAGSREACTFLGFAYLARGGAGAHAAAQAFSAACTRHDVSGCRALAALFETGHGVERDVRKAAEVYAQACDRNDAFSCFRLGDAYRHGRGVPLDARRAAALAVKACDGGEPRGCTLYAAELAAAKDVRQALTFYQRACEANEAVACAELGARYEAGDGVARDLRRATNSYFTRACAGGLGPACTRAGALFERAPGLIDLPRAAGLYERGCALGHAEACFNLGVMYAEGRGRDKDLAKALSLYQHACRLGLKQVCALAAQLGRSMASPAPAPGSPSP